MKTLIYIIAFLISYYSVAQDVIFSEEDKQAILLRHNHYRSRVGVPPLVWSGKLEAIAQAWADTLAAQDKGLRHSGWKYGENIAGASVLVSAQFIVDLWAREKVFYHGGAITPDNRAAHYTQIVWHTTRKVGCALSRSKSGFYYWVCEYYPPGNYIGERPYRKRHKRPIK